MTKASCNGHNNNDDSDWIEEYVPNDLLKVVDWSLQTDHAKILNIHSRYDLIIHAFNEIQDSRLDLIFASA